MRRSIVGACRCGGNSGPGLFERATRLSSNLTDGRIVSNMVGVRSVPLTVIHVTLRAEIGRGKSLPDAARPRGKDHCAPAGNACHFCLDMPEGMTPGRARHAPHGIPCRGVAMTHD